MFFRTHLIPEKFHVLGNLGVGTTVSFLGAIEPAIGKGQIADGAVTRSIHGSESALGLGIGMPGRSQEIFLRAVTIDGNAVAVEIFFAFGFLRFFQACDPGGTSNPGLRGVGGFGL